MPKKSAAVAASLFLLLNAIQLQTQGLGPQRSSDGIWQVFSEAAIRGLRSSAAIAGSHAVVRLDKASLDAQLARVTVENSATPARSEVIITLPLPDGRFSRFRIEESPMLAPELAAAFPDIKTYRGTGVDDPTATTRIDWTLRGFHAMVIAAGGTVYIDPYTRGDLVDYISYSKADQVGGGVGSIDLVNSQLADQPFPRIDTSALTNGTTRRTYRLALAAAAEYTAAAGGTKAAALASMTTTMNRVNGIYERDLSVHLTMVTGTAADVTALIYTNAATDPYTNSDRLVMLTENQANLDAVIGSSNYDLGHVFAVENQGGAALIGLCSITSKGSAVSGNLLASGDYFDVNTVSHEFGHQFGANHTFNGTAGTCSGSRVALHAFEPGGGSTIMGYNAVCGDESLQVYAGDYFNYESLNEMTAYLASGAGASCGTQSTTGNTAPTVSAGLSYAIPRNTPFTLTASGHDVDGDALTYTWEEHDLGTMSSSAATASTDDGSRPLFRSNAPTSSPSRTFPSLSDILNNANVPPPTFACQIGVCLTGEVLPSTSRTMTFIVTARDNRAGGGAIASAETHVIVTSDAGPFSVTSPNTAVSWRMNASQLVTWNVANTSAAPINAANVRISLSTDGGLTFPIVLAASTPNTGTASVVVPNAPTATARVKVEAVGNIFFDISNTNFTIAAGFGNDDGDHKADLVVFRPVSGTWYTRYSSLGYGIATATAVQWGLPGDVPIAGDFDGDGMIELTVWRPSTGTWFIRYSSQGYDAAGYQAFQWGLPGDVPLAGDFDGDGRAELTVYRPSNGTWYLRYSSQNYSMTPYASYQWGLPGDLPMIADFDGDGKDELAVFRPTNGTWYIRYSLLGYDPGAFATFQWGLPGDVPIAGDFDGDVKTDLAVWRPSNGTWYVRYSSLGYGVATGSAFQWGLPGDVPTVRDFDGDGKTDLTVWRPSNGTWYVRYSAQGYSAATAGAFQWGLPGDGPID